MFRSTRVAKVLNGRLKTSSKIVFAAGDYP